MDDTTRGKMAGWHHWPHWFPGRVERVHEGLLFCLRHETARRGLLRNYGWTCLAFRQLPCTGADHTSYSGGCALRPRAHSATGHVRPLRASHAMPCRHDRGTCPSLSASPAWCRNAPPFLQLRPDCPTKKHLRPHEPHAKLARTSQLCCSSTKFACNCNKKRRTTPYTHVRNHMHPIHASGPTPCLLSLVCFSTISRFLPVLKLLDLLSISSIGQ